MNKIVNIFHDACFNQMPSKGVEGGHWSGLKLEIKHFYGNRLIKTACYTRATVFLCT